MKTKDRRRRVLLSLAGLSAVGFTAVASFDVEPVTLVENLGVRPEDQSSMEDAQENAAVGSLVAPTRGRGDDEGAPSISLYSYARMNSYQRFMDQLGAERHRVKIRSVETAFGNHAPVFYPAMHWIPSPMLQQELTAPDARYSLEQFEAMARDAGRDNFRAFVLMGMLNVRLLVFDEEEEGGCCNPTAELVVELAADARDPRILRFDMTELERGVYYVDDPHDAAGTIVSEVISIGERPIMSIVALTGTGFARARPDVRGIPYAIRWGTLDLEYGSHLARDPKAVIR